MNRLPNEFLCVHAGAGYADRTPGRITNRACALLHWGAWLPIETDYARAIGALRAKGRTVAQVCYLKSTGSAALLREVFRQVLLKCIEIKATDLIAAVPPESAEIYRRKMHFKSELRSDWQIALCGGDAEVPPGRWILARDINGGYLPVRVLRLDLSVVGDDTVASFLGT